MVRLRKRRNMPVFENLTVSVNGSKEVEVEVAITKNLIMIDCSMNAGYDCMIYKTDCVLQATEEIDTLEMISEDGKRMFKFGSEESKTYFCKLMWDIPEQNAPLQSPESSITPSPPPTSPSTPSPTQSPIIESSPAN